MENIKQKYRQNTVKSGFGTVERLLRSLLFCFQQPEQAENAGVLFAFLSWGCCNRIVNGRAECDSHHVNEEVLEATYLAAMRALIDSAEDVIEAVRDGAELALEPENKAALDRIDEQIIEIQEAVLALHKAKQRMEISATDYAAQVKEHRERMKTLEADRDTLQGTAVKYAEVKTWLNTFIEQTMQGDALTTVDGTTMKMLVDRIQIRNEGIVVEFKCGVAIEQEYVK